MTTIRSPKITLSFCVLVMLACFASPAAADNDDPPTRVARLAYARGSVSFQPSGTDDWVTAAVNRPVTVGDKFWSDNDGRAELQLDGSLLRLSNNTGFSFLNLNDNTTQIELSAGTLLIRVRRLDENETYEIDAPNLAFSVLRPGLYRITVDEAGDSTVISVRSGEGEVTGGGAAYTINARDSYVFSGTEQLYATRENLGEDQFESWAAMRDRRWETSRTAHYVSTDVVGYEDLDDHGDWRQTSDYGNVWFPRVSNSEWAPYHYGHWCYIEPWGYTWVDDEPWGFAPFHYGRWVNYHGAWGWVPMPPRRENTAYVRPVYAPALVAWVAGGSGAAVAWFPLGPREVYVPSYPVSRNYVNNVNVSNTTVSTTVVNNYYNTTIVNKTTTVTNVNYVNRSVPGAVTATTAQTFTTAQPVAKNVVKVDQRTVASAPVKAVAPPVVPAKQAVLGNATATAKPPANIQTRTVVAKAVPPPPPPSFEKRQAAIQNNGGKPLSPAQMRQIQPAATARPTASVKVAPAAKPSTTPPPPPPNHPAPSPTKPAPNVTPTPNRPVSSNPAPQPNRPAEWPNPPTPAKPEPSKPPTAAPAPNRSPERPPEHPSNPATPNEPSTPPAANHPATPAHPNERPPAARPTTPPPNPGIDKKQQQEQEQLRAKQQQERQKLQQQQERARAQQQADQTRKQQLERQHQQQAEQLQQKHTQEQKKLEQKQQQERQQKNKPQKPEQPQP